MRARGTLTVLRHLPRQRRAHRRTPGELAARRDRRIRALVRYAAETVPRYRALAPETIRGAADLERLPVLEKHSAQADPDGFRSRSPLGAHAVMLRTTGSTATPLTIYHDRRSLLANIAYSERERAVEWRFAGRRFGYPVFEIRAPAGTVSHVLAYYADATYRPLRPRHRQLTVDTPPEEILAAVDHLRPAVIRSYGGFLELLFRVADASGGLRHRPAAVVYAGDTMSDGGRELIERRFGVPVLSAYNAVEAFKIAFTCEERAGFHLHEDLCHVWLADGDGAPVAAGERGEVVITNLVNRGTVLLNYRIGDVARMTAEPCRCGRTTRRLVDLDGRVDDIFELPGGTFVYPTQVWRVFRERPSFLRYQLVQLAPDRFELRFAGDGSEAAGAAVAEALPELRSVLCGSRVDAVPVAELPAGPGGKFRHLVPLGSGTRGGRAHDRG